MEVANMQQNTKLLDHELLAIALENIRNMPEPEYWDHGLYEGEDIERPDLSPNKISGYAFGGEENDYDYAFLSDSEDTKEDSFRPAEPLPHTSPHSPPPNTSGVILKRNVSSPNPENYRGPIPMPRRKRSKKVSGTYVRRSLSAPNSPNYRIQSNPIPIPGCGHVEGQHRKEPYYHRRQESEPGPGYSRGPMPLPGKFTKHVLCSEILERPPAPLPPDVSARIAIAARAAGFSKDLSSGGVNDEGDYDYAELCEDKKPESVLAKAMFDNVGETTEELNFHRGDILTVLEEEPAGFPGWWLCALHGRTGIAPGNRLQIFTPAARVSMDAQQHQQQQQQKPQQQPPCGPSTNGESGQAGEPYQTQASQQKGSVNWHRRSWHMHPDKHFNSSIVEGSTFSSGLSHARSQPVLTPQKFGGVYVYDQPNAGYQDYDVPPSRYFPKQMPPAGPQQSFDGPQALYDTPSSLISNKRAVNSDVTEVYDVPPPAAHAHIPGGALYPASNRSSTASMRSTGSTMSSMSSPCGATGSNPPSTCGSTRSSIEVQDIYDVPPPAKAVVQPAKSPLVIDQQHCTVDPMGIYDTPPKQPGAKILIEDFDHEASQRDADSGIEAFKEENAYEAPHNKSFSGERREHYIDDIYDRPTNNARAVAWGQQGRVQGLQVTGGTNDGSVYDIPPQVTRDSAISMRSDTSSLLDDISNRLSSCSVASSGCSSDIPPIPYDELPLDIDSAMELLVKLQQEVHSATSRLLSFVHSSWRERSELEPKLYDIRLGCLGVQATLQEFVDFGQGALANSAKADDKKLVKKLSQLLEPLQGSKKSVNKCLQHLNEIKWAIHELTDCEKQGEADALGCIVSQAKDIPTNVRTMASCIQGNSTLLFKRSTQQDENSSSAQSSPKKAPPVRPKPPVLPKPKGPVKQEVTLERRTSVQDRPLPPPPQMQELASPGMDDHDTSGVYEVPHGDEEPEDDKVKYTKADFMEDYDYVHLENRPPHNQDSAGIGGEDETDSGIVSNDSGSGLSARFKERLDQIQGNGAIDNNNTPTKTSHKHTYLHPNDKQLLMFYAGQVSTHTTQLVNAIDAFFQCIEYTQPPKVFIAHSKNVVLAAHKMVYICDTLHRNLMSEEVRVKVMACANYLCDCLKLTVNTTKNAALQFPNVVTVQEMVDRVVDVSHAANEIKLLITQAAIL